MLPAAKGSRNLAISWNQITGAEGYDVFFVKCGEDNTCKLVKTIKGNKTLSWTKTGLKKKTAYKAFVKAYVMKDGKKSYVGTSPLVHAYTTGYTKNYTNPKSVTVRKASVSLKTGKTYKIKANVKKLKKGKKLMPSGHDPKLRYLSSNKKVAAVSSSGKITAKAKGSCKIYVYAVNGASKTVKVTVK
ncbi:MAG: Ig-like domain-containing protein [Bacillota bacterium]